MKCYNCNKIFNISRTFKNLLSNPKYFVCNTCYKDNPVNLEYYTLPLDNYTLKVLCLYREKIVNYNAFIIEYSYVVKRYVKNYIIMVDRLNINEYTLNIYNIIANLIEQDLLIITYNSRK